MDIAQGLQLPGVSPIEPPAKLRDDLTTLPGLISALLPIIFTVAGLILFAMLLWGGYDLLLSGGDSAKATSAKGKITTAFIGFIIVFFSFWITRFILSFFHLE